MSESSFLTGGGEMGRRIAEHAWTGSLGPVASWPGSLKTTVGLLLHSPIPMVLLWGEDGVMLYNDAYSIFAGGRHPQLLGSRVREGWPEVADFNDNVMKVGLAGGTLTYADQELTLHRTGEPEQVWMNLDYSPVIDESGRPGGVIAIVVETTVQVMTQRRLASEREQFARLFDQAPTFMAMLSGPGHRFDLANPGYLRLVGDRPLLGLTIAEALPEAVAQGYVDLLDEVYRSGQAFSARGARFSVHDPVLDTTSERFVDFVYQPIFDPERRTVGVFVEGVDVTDRVMAESRREVLVRLTDRLRELDDPSAIGAAALQLLGEALGAARVGYAAVDPDAETVAVQQAWTRSGVDTLPRPVSLRAYGSFVDDLKAGDTVVVPDVSRDARTRGRLDALPAESVAALVNVPVIEHGRLVALLSVNHDQPRAWPEEDVALIREVTERTRTAVERGRGQVALRESEQRLRDANTRLHALIEAQARALHDSEDFTRLALSAVSGVGVWTYDVASDRFTCDAAVAELYGVDPALGAAGVPRAVFLANVHPDDRERLAAVMGDGLLQRGDIELEYRIRHPEGAVRWVLSRGHTYFEKGAPVRRTGIGVETTRPHLLEEQLRQSQKMEAVGQLTGGLAHDFNNLLTGITGSLELLQARIAQGRIDAVERYVTAAQGAARRAAALTHRLLAFSRRQTLDPRITDVNRLVADLEELIRRTVGPPAHIEVVRAAGLWPTLIDQNQLENALINLCINARDAMPEGGRITIETANIWLDERAARERDLAPGQYVSLCVTDTGTGMTPQVQARAFDPFFTTKPMGEGTGLGLSMIYGFVRQSGGQARIYSELGHGTTVCLYLPRDRSGGEIEPGHLGTNAVPASVGGGQVVLVVDDEPTIRMLIAEVLQEAGYASIEAGDGPAGLRVLQSNARIDLLITDVGLPGGMNGRQIADAARVLRPGLKVLFITGYAENAAVGGGHLEPGMQVLTKPFAMETLAQRVRGLVES